MRRLSTGSREAGVTAVVVALSMVVLLSFTALAVDVGRLYWERRQLQNGADLAALSIAEACARGLTNADCVAPALAGQDLVNRNSNDGRSDATVNLDTSQGRVQVDTAAFETGAPVNSISMTFARIFGVASEEVGARAVARWGAPSGTSGAFPLAFSICEVDSSPTANGQLQYLLAHGVQDPNDDDKCTNPSGQEVPGGFGWLISEPSTGCSANTSIGNWEDGGTGNKSGLNAACKSLLASWINRLKNGDTVTVLFPVFDQADKFTKSYHIYAYAAVEIHGWHFFNLNNPAEPDDYLPGTMANWIKGLGYNNEDLGFTLKFVRYVFEDEGTDITPIPSPYGTNIVKLTE